MSGYLFVVVFLFFPWPLKVQQTQSIALHKRIRGKKPSTRIAVRSYLREGSILKTVQKLKAVVQGEQILIYVEARAACLAFWEGLIWCSGILGPVGFIGNRAGLIWDMCICKLSGCTYTDH